LPHPHGGILCAPGPIVGHDRDGKKNKLQVNYGLLTTREGCPVAISVYEGNTADAKTLMPEVKKLRAHKRRSLLEATRSR
jgi:transposase